MTPAEITQIESQLNLSLPQEYRDAILSHPLPDSSSYNYEFCGHYETLLAENNLIRDNGFFDHDWNSALFIIGFDGCGNKYFITTSPFDGRIYFADHEEDFDLVALTKNEYYESFSEFNEFLIEVEDDIRYCQLITTNQ